MAGEVVDAGHRGFSFLCRGELHRAALGVFFESVRQSGQQGVCAKDAQHFSYGVGDDMDFLLFEVPPELALIVLES